VIEVKMPSYAITQNLLPNVLKLMSRQSDELCACIYLLAGRKTGSWKPAEKLLLQENSVESAIHMLHNCKNCRVPFARTNRFKNSFLLYALQTFQWVLL